MIIKFVEMSEPDKEGVRILTFEVNGFLRDVPILDETSAVKVDRHLKADKNNPAHIGSAIPGTITQVFVKEGEEVKKNQALLVVEAMKMETTVVATEDGKVDHIYVAAGDSVHSGDLLLSFVK